MHGLTGGGWKRKRPGHGHHRWDDLAGNRRNADPGTYHRLAPPRLPPTLHRAAASSRIFAALDHYLWQLTYKWACFSHKNKSRAWIISRYYGRFNPASNDRWIFGNRHSGAWLPRLGWTKIVRHSLVLGAASPDDPALTDYWANRRGKNAPLLDRSVLILLAKQHGRCALCRGLLLQADH